jgi:hypothetical protein
MVSQRLGLGTWHTNPWVGGLRHTYTSIDKILHQKQSVAIGQNVTKWENGTLKT